MKKHMLLAFTLMVSFFLPSVSEVFAAPFSPFWEWEQPKMVGRIKTIEEDGPNLSRKMFYDKDGKRTEAQRLDDVGRIINRYFFVYNKDHDLVLIECYSKNNANPLRETVYYAEKGVIKLIDSFESPRRAAFEYDDHKRVKDVVVMDDKGLTKAKWTFLYDDKGRFVGERYTDLEGVYAGKRMLEYNGKGFISSQTVYNGKDEVTSKRTYTYEYDKPGNWIKKTTVFLDYAKGGKKPAEMKSVVQRRISYYPSE